jgi:hypothetical protein
VDRNIIAVLFVPALEQVLGVLHPARGDIEVREAIAHRPDPRRPVRHRRQRIGVRIDKVLVGLDRDIAIVARHLDHQLEKRRVEDVRIDLALQDLDDLIEIERVVLMRRRRERRCLDRDLGRCEASPRRGVALLAHDFGDPLGTRDVLGHAGPVEVLEARRLGGGREVGTEVVIPGRPLRSKCSPCRRYFFG